MDTDDFVQDIYLQFLEMLNRNSEKDVKNTHFKIKFAFLNTLRHIRVQHKHRYNTATNNEWETTISSWSYRRKKEHDLELEYAVKEIYENIKSKLPPTQKQILDFIILSPGESLRKNQKQLMYITKRSRTSLYYDIQAIQQKFIKEGYAYFS